VRAALFTAAVLLATACPSPPPHAGADAALQPKDAATTEPADAGVAPDAGTDQSDAALPPDAEMPADASWDPALATPALPCTDLVDSVYVTPGNLPPYADGVRGDILLCAQDIYFDVPAAQHELDATGVLGVTAVSGVTFYRIAYRTTRKDGVPGVGTARVYVPETPKPGPLPVIVAGHPSNGVADDCAPSKDPASNRDLAMPWAALGYAVIVPDYAGLGNETVQGYLDNRDTAHSLLDAARALRKLFKPGAFEPRVVLAGYSQGGGAVLTAQAIEKLYGAGGPIAAAIIFAAQWPERMNSFGMVSMLQHPTDLTIAWGITKPPVLEMRLYAYYTNSLGAAHGTDGFPAAKRTNMKNALDTTCLKTLGGVVQGIALHVSDLIDDTLRTTFLACVSDPLSAGCVDPGKTLYNDLLANEVKADPTGAPVLYVQGLADRIMPAEEEAACNIDKLKADGLTPQVCTDQTSDHPITVEHNIAFAIIWAQARLAGQPAPSCSAAGMPACKP
jgi:predicted esterase